MPNHVTNKLIFDASHVEAIKEGACTDGQFDFEKLIPSPPHMYRGNISAEDEQDFPINWNSWSRANWGTKWNAYNCNIEVMEDGKASLQFDTAWSVPYPVISAFANRFQIPFEHRYYDEGHNFWGVETWGKGTLPGELILRTSKRKKLAADRNALCIELKSYSPDEDDDEDDATGTDNRTAP